MIGAFKGATSFNQDILNWNTENVIGMSSMFEDAATFNQDISNWNTFNVNRMTSMFEGASSFNQDISNWNTENVVFMGEMFKGATSFDQDIGNWNISNLETANGMFNGVTLSTANYDALLIGWNVQSLQPNISFSGGNSKYCSGEEARQNMIDYDGWIITDAGYEGTCLPNCTAVFDPENEATGVSIDASLTWTEVADATGYKIEIGTESGISDVLNDDLFNVTTYTPNPSWLPETTYYVTITPYNEVGDAEEDCIETQFITEIIATAPDCTSVFDPEDGAMGVSINASLTWAAIANATGYKIEIGTETGISDVLNEDLFNVTTYTPSPSWLPETTYYVTITPYNEVGDAEEDCIETQFTTEIIATAPDCTTVIDPEDESTEVSINASLTWTEIDNATGYKITIGTEPGLSDVLNTDLLNVTTYTPNPSWLSGTTYYITITPYNEVGDAEEDCIETQFTTEIIAIVPDCTTVIDPEDESTEVSINASLTWTEIDNATGYKITIGTEPDLSDVLNTDLLNVTTYTPNPSWLSETTYYVTITPYNEVGDAEDDCIETSFTTEIPIGIPNCTAVNSPADGAEGLPIDISLSWQAVEEATGYKITIGTSSGGTNIEDNTDLGNVIIYTPSFEWLEETTYYVTVIAYNENGDALSCVETQFTTRGALFVPNAFTPDGDGLNDTFNIINIDLLYPNYQIHIFDRWGNVVYKGKNGWNGVSENFRSTGSKKVRQGVYYVLVILNGSETLKKTLTVEY